MQRPCLRRSRLRSTQVVRRFSHRSVVAKSAVCQDLPAGFQPSCSSGALPVPEKRSGTCFLKYPQGNLMTFQGIENVYEWRPGQDMSGSSNIFQLSTNCLLEDDPNDILQLLRFHQLDAGQVIHDCREIVWANLVQQACSLSTAIIRRSKKMKDMLKILEEFCP